MEKKKILVAVDGSDYSDKVIEKAIDYARFLDAEVVFVYCHKQFPKLLGRPYRNQVISAIRDETEELVRPYIERLKEAGVAVVERLMEEPAGVMIARVADHEKCELIIMGSRGLTGLEGLLIGSVTHRVLHIASCSVLVVK